MVYEDDMTLEQHQLFCEAITHFHKCKTCTHLHYIIPCQTEDGIYDIGCKKHRMFNIYCTDYQDCRQ